MGDDTGVTMISACYSTADVKGNDVVGGLVGISSGYGSISDCYATGSVTGNDRVGGLIGFNFATVSACYSKGNVSGTNHVGGLVGDGPPVPVVDSFWDIETSDCNTSADGIGKTTADMQTMSTFTDAGWDFVAESVNGTEDIWTICEQADYPKLTWQFLIGDWDGDDDVDLLDFAIFARHWLQADNSFWCDGGGTDLTNDGNVNFNDLKAFADNWLEGC